MAKVGCEFKENKISMVLKDFFFFFFLSIQFVSQLQQFLINDYIIKSYTPFYIFTTIYQNMPLVSILM